MSEPVFREKKVISKYVDEEGYFVHSAGREVEYVGFWLRLYGQHFRPCFKCQKQLIELLNNAELKFEPDTMSVGFRQMVDEKKDAIYYEFSFPFVNQLVRYTWQPCKEDQEKLRQIIIDCKSFRIGNKDYTDPVELYREFDIDDKSWEEIEKRPATDAEKKKFGD